MNRGDGNEQRPPGRPREPRAVPPPTDPQSVPMGSLGTWLRSQREARGVSLRDIAEASKISLRHLEALERDRFDALPAPVFVRGFLREYARIVGLDVDEVVNVYLLAAEAARPAQDARREAASPPVTPRRGPTVLVYAALAVGLIALVLGVAAALSFWLGRPRAPAPEPAGAAGPATPAAPGDHADPEPVAAASPTAALPETAGAPVGEVAAPPAAVAVEPEPRPAAPWLPESTSPSAPGAAATAPEAAPQPLRVVLEFQQDCWVEVVVDGRRRESELKAGGETWAIEAADSVVLTLGNAPAVRVEVDGRPVELPMEGTRVVREFRIDRQTGATASALEPAGT